MKKPRWRRIVRGLVIALAVLVMLIALVVGFFHTSMGKDIIRDRVEKTLAERVDGHVRIGSLDYTFLFGSIQLGEIEIRDRTDAPAIRIGRLEIDLDRSSIVAGDPLIDRIAVKDLEVSIVRTADGRSNLSDLFVPSTGRGSLARVRVSQLVVDGKVTVVAPAGTVEIENLALTASLGARPLAGELDLALASLAAEVTVTRPARPATRVAVNVGATTLAQRSTGLDLAVGATTIGPLGFHSAIVRRGGDSNHIALRGVRLGRAQLAQLLGTDILTEDVLIDATLDGALAALRLDGAVRAGVSTLAITGSANLAAARPSYEMQLVGTELRSRLVRIEGMPDVTSALRITARGAGRAPDDIEGTVDVAVIALGVTLTGSAKVARGRALDANLSVSAATEEVLGALDRAGVALPAELVRRRAQLPPQLELSVSAAGTTDGRMAVTLAPTKLALARGTLTLGGSAIVDKRVLHSARGRVTLAGLDIAALAALAGRPPAARGRLSGTIDLEREGERARASYALSLALPRATVAVRGTATPREAVARATIATGGSRIATIAATLPLEKRGESYALRRTSPWKLAIDVDRTSSKAIAPLLPPDQRVRLVEGELELHAAIAGTPARPRGAFTLDAGTATVRARTTGTLATTASGTAIVAKSDIAVGADSVATIDATFALPLLGPGVDAARLRRDARVEAAIDLPARSFASLAAMSPELAKLARLPGTIGGRIAVHGAATAPTFDAALAWSGYRTAADTEGRTTITANGTPHVFTVDVAHGAFTIAARVDRTNSKRIAVTATTSADTPLLPLLPALVAPHVAGHDVGRLTSTLAGAFTLVGDRLEDVSATGALAINGGTFALPGTTRHYRDLGLSITATPTGLGLAASAREADRESSARTASATGTLAFANQRPSVLALHLVAQDWLVSGAVLGPADAPKGTLAADIDIAVDLAAPILAIDATINALTLNAPDRADLMRQPEPMPDIIYVQRGERVLPVEPVRAATARRPLAIRVHIPEPIQITQGTMSVQPRGDLAVDLPALGPPRLDGMFHLAGGSLGIFGQTLNLVAGTVELSERHPAGHVEVTFERALDPLAIRETSASTPPVLRATLSGPPTSLKVKFSGAANTELPDVVATSNLNHARTLARPGLTVSESVQVPHGMQIMMTAFFAMLMPKLLFLDRIAAWSDPADERYGIVEHVHADRYLARDRARIRGLLRPPTVGRSSAELHFDRMLLHTDRTSAGVGLRAGNRGGGGVGLFFEWSSRD